MKEFLTTTVLLLFVSVAYAYIEPGMRTSTFVIIIGIIIAILLGLISIIWYPLKKLIERMKNK